MMEPEKVEETAEQSSTESSSWWDVGWGMVTKAAEQVVQVYKEDLGEFVGAVAVDTSQAVEEVKASKWVSDAKDLAVNNALVTQFVQSIASEDGSDDGLEPTIVATSRFEAKLADLQRDIGTYCTNPSEEDVYAEFCKNFKIDSRENQVAALLAANAILQAQHTKLVPVVVSYEDFWKRYLFREIRLREREEERERLILKASVVVAGDDEMPWDDVDEDHEPQQQLQQVISPIAPHSSVVAPSPSAFDSSAIMLGDGWGDDDDGDVDVNTLTTPTAAAETKTQHNNTTSTNTTLDSQNTTAVTEDSDWTGWE